MTDRQKRVLFFRDNAGFATPPGRMACAKLLADAEEFADAHDLTVQWEYDTVQPGDCCANPHNCFCIAKIESGVWDCLYAVVKADNEILASLSGIILVADDPDYRRVLEAELFLEAKTQLLLGAEILHEA